MKKTGLTAAYGILLTFVFSLMQLFLSAQDSTGKSTTVTTETTTTTTSWYTEPWVWIVGGAVFILILVALIRGNSSKDREVTRSSTTVIKDDRPR